MSLFILKKLSIRGKLTLIGLVTTGMALLVASMVFVIHEVVSFRYSLVDSLTVQAEMVGSNCTAALAFNNRKDAAEILGNLSAAPNIVQAAVYAKNGSVFASYQRPGETESTALPSSPPEGHVFGVNRLTLVMPILLDRERVGSIYIRSDLREFYSRMRWYAGTIVLAFAGSLLLAFLLLSRLQKTITAPILDLVRLMGVVSRSKDYSVRSTVEQEDETGNLATGFNEMLSQIQSRDRELERYRDQLEKEVILRTAELAKTNEQLQQELAERKRTEDQLRHAQKMDAVGRLSGGVAHDFNNILTAIIGYGSILQMKMPDNDPLRRNVDEILASAARATTVTQSLLAFSRKQAINTLPVNLSRVIERVSKLLQRLIGEDITLVLKSSEGELIVVADSGQLEQVLMNLATNARDAMPHGGQLTIETGRVVVDERYRELHEYIKQGSYALITVSDTGGGMDQTIVPRIFEPFFTTKEVGKGTGLGLSIVYGIVKQHNGYIDVYSEPGHGTTFKIYLPLSEEEEKTAGDHHFPTREVRGGTETVFVAEDDASIRRLVRSVLAEAGYKVIEAVDGLDAIDKIRQHHDKIQMLLLDVIMPKKNGREVYEEAKKLMPEVKTLFMSGYTADIIRNQGLSYDGQEFVSKPISPRELLDKIRTILDRKR